MRKRLLLQVSCIFLLAAVGFADCTRNFCDLSIFNDISGVSISERQYNSWMKENGDFILERFYKGESPFLSGEKFVDAEIMAQSNLLAQISSNIESVASKDFKEKRTSDGIEVEASNSMQIKSSIKSFLKNPITVTVVNRKNKNLQRIYKFKCKQEFRCEQEEYDRKWLEMAEDSYYDFEDQIDNDPAKAFESLVKSYIYGHTIIDELTGIDIKADIESDINDFLGNISIRPVSSVDGRVNFTNSKDIRISISVGYNGKPLNGFGVAAEYIKGAVYNNTDGWMSNRKSFSSSNGGFSLDLGTIVSRTSDVRIRLVPDIRYIVSGMDGTSVLGKEKINSLVLDRSYGDEVALDFTTNISAKINKNNLKPREKSFIRKLERNFSDRKFNISKRGLNEIYVKSIDDGMFNLSLKSSSGTTISTVKISRDGSLDDLYDAIFSSNIFLDMCDNNRIVVKNVKFQDNDFVYTKQGKSSFNVMNGKSRLTFFYKEFESPWLDTTLFIYDDIDISGWDMFVDSRACFEPKTVPYSYTVISPTDLDGAYIKWDSESDRYSQTINGFESLSSPLFGANDRPHKITILKDGYKPYKATIPPHLQSSYSTAINMEKLDPNILSNMKYYLVPGTFHRDFYKATPWRQAQSLVYNLLTIYLNTKLGFSSVQYLAAMVDYDSAKEDYIECINDGNSCQQEYNEKERLRVIAQDKGQNTIVFGSGVSILYGINSVELTIAKFIF